MVITDHFTKYATSQSDCSATKGPDFELHTIRELCELAGVKQMLTTPYHPQDVPIPIPIPSMSVT